MNCQSCAEWLQLSPRTVARLADRKEIPATKVAGKWRFLKSELVEFLKGKEVKS